MAAPPRVIALINKFKANFDYYQSPNYNEEQLRQEFLNPFFEELGWDMENRSGKGADREVHYEKRIKAGAPDYGFYVGNQPRFFVEAKKPAKNVCADPDAALQLRSYGWSAGVPQSVLTDFEEFSIYDTTVRPKVSDQARIARFRCSHYLDFGDLWNDIAELFSREAVLAGSLERHEKKRVTQTVDAELLVDISRWRKALAQNFAAQNPSLTEEQLNFAVQDTLDRIIFLRICEDRDIEPRERLRATIEGSGSYSKLLRLFDAAERRYDSGLFRTRQQQALRLDDNILGEVISELYFPKSPYKFDAIPAEILGQVYEQFLGKVIRLNASHHATIEEKPEVRKAGGVYYTPVFIVEYIVQNTLGQLLRGKSPETISDLTVVDPACGSGSFLIGAYQYLIDWHRDWYASHSPDKQAKKGFIWRDDNGIWQLSLSERRRILLTHCYGVDIDRQAVEVAKLSLMLKALEAPEQKNLLTEQMLPDLASNIKCGNSLIGTDFFSGQLTADPSERARINPFDWRSEFPDVFQRGGFDVVIGNPPYISYSGRQAEELPDNVRKYYEDHYGAMRWPTAHSLFIEHSIRNLSRRYVAFIVPDQIGHLDGYQTIREIISTHSNLRDVRYWGEHVFVDAVTPSLTFIADKKYKGATSISLFEQETKTLKLYNPDFLSVPYCPYILAWLVAKLRSYL
ncbi:MAG: N-6 DNA methylase [Parcubacteria group bacterium]|nr:N-6 DNA methylase [Parcubacteria group bacterium]